LTGAIIVPRFGTNLSGANLKNATLQGEEVGDALVDESTVYNQWTVFPDGFDPNEAGLRFELSPFGDFDGDETRGVADIDALIAKIRGIHRSKSLSVGEMFDINIDGSIDQDDLEMWVKDLEGTWFGDTNLDGLFNSADLVNVLQAGQYDDGVPYNSSWATGDWNGDAEFDSADLVRALQDGGYERVSLAAANAVPEPSSLALTIVAAGLIVATFSRRKTR
jgi:hypothetical protein